MKRLALAIALTVSFVAHAAYEHVATIALADQDSIVKTASKTGELSGYPMLGAMTAMALSANPVTGHFGELNEGVNAAIVIFVDTAKTNLNSIDEFECDIAILCSPKFDKSAFAASKGGACEEIDGVLRVKQDDDDEYAYTAYSEDGKWASLSDKREIAQEALKYLASVRQALDGDVLRLEIPESGIEVLRRIVEASAKTCERPLDKARKENISLQLRDVQSFTFGVRVSDAGIDLRGTLNPVESSVLTKCGSTPIDGAPLGFAPEDAYIATDCAENAGGISLDADAQAKRIFELCDKYGVKHDFIKREGEGNMLKWTFDFTKFAEYANGEGKAALDKLDIEKVAEDLNDIRGSWTNITEKTPATKTSFSLVGKKPSISPAVRFARIMPQAAQVKPYFASSYAFYALLKTLLPDIVAATPDEDGKAEWKTILATLPDNDAGAVCGLLWRDGAAHNCFVRISADEVRSLSALGTSIFTCIVMKSLSSSQIFECGCDDDDDGDADDAGDDHADDDDAKDED